MTRLNGKTALITGSTDGVGRLVAKRLGEAGASVLVHGRNRERGERLVAVIKEGGGSAEFLAGILPWPRCAALPRLSNKGRIGSTS